MHLKLLNYVTSNGVESLSGAITSRASTSRPLRDVLKGFGEWSPRLVRLLRRDLLVVVAGISLGISLAASSALILLWAKRRRLDNVAEA